MKTRDAVLTGRVTESGKPQARAVVEYARLDTAAPPNEIRTTAGGTFIARVRITATTTFAAEVPDADTARSGPSPTPRGRASLTVIGTTDKVVRVAVPKRD